MKTIRRISCLVLGLMREQTIAGSDRIHRNRTSYGRACHGSNPSCSCGQRHRFSARRSRQFRASRRCRFGRAGRLCDDADESRRLDLDCRASAVGAVWRRHRQCLCRARQLRGSRSSMAARCPYVEAIARVGIVKQNRSRGNTFASLKSSSWRKAGRRSGIYPSDTFSIRYDIDFPHPADRKTKS